MDTLRRLTQQLNLCMNFEEVITFSFISLTCRQNQLSMKRIFVLSSIFISLGIWGLSFVWSNAWWLFILFGPIILVGYYDMIQKKHTIRRNFPVIGNFRYMLERIRPEIMQYFVETDTEGRPFNRLERSLIYQRAKKVNATTPFGTQTNVYAEGYEWLDHSIYPVNQHEIGHDPRVLIGGPDCSKPYSASLYNISAMSFGSLSNRAILALNGGAKMGKFYHNTGEGGLSPYHLKPGGDLTWQIGTGYFGCRNQDGTFSEELFKKGALHPHVKMIEIKLSQGAKPGHGGILPGVKNTEEIAAIRKVEPHTTVFSPPFHSSFSNSEEMMYFIKKLRDLSGGKPIGIKLCVGRKVEFVSICRAMIKTGIKPDFITVDGGEGGTGAAPIEFSNSIGMPLRDGLSFVRDMLDGFDLKKDIRIIASGKIVTGFHIARAIALGADLCNSARGMMLALGCIQALQCNVNTCPVGVATQNKSLIRGLDVDSKAVRVANFHEDTIHNLVELVGAAGIKNPCHITRVMINRRVNMDKVRRFDQIYPIVETGAFLNADTVPERYRELLAREVVI